MPQEPMMTCALVIGHKAHSPGAVNKDRGITEFAFNEELARVIEARQTDVKIQRVYRRTYSSLPSDINELDPDFTVSLHCNAYNRRTSGSEVLYYHRSEKGKKLAQLLIAELVNALGLRNRGVKAKNSEDRGGYLLNSVRSPCVISEPFFIDNKKDLEVALSKKEELADAYVSAISKFGSQLTALQLATADSLQEDDDMYKHWVFFDVPEGSVMTLRATDDNGQVLYNAHLKDPTTTVSTWQTVDIRHPSFASDDLSDSDYFVLTVNLIFRDDDKATVSVLIEDPTGNQFATKNYKVDSKGQLGHIVEFTFLMA